MAILVYLGLGSNLGEREVELRWALDGLSPDIAVTGVSALYETAPIGVTDQPAFLNAVCAGATELEPMPLLARLKQIERDAGRVAGPRWGPRPLDLDVLLYDGLQMSTQDLVIPHPRLTERAFVLQPLADLAPELAIPGDGRTVSQLLQLVGEQEIRRVAGGGWNRITSGL